MVSLKFLREDQTTVLPAAVKTFVWWRNSTVENRHENIRAALLFHPGWGTSWIFANLSSCSIVRGFPKANWLVEILCFSE